MKPPVKLVKTVSTSGVEITFSDGSKAEMFDLQFEAHPAAGVEAVEQSPRYRMHASTLRELILLLEAHLPPEDRKQAPISGSQNPH